jgi:hypothetical protein
MGKVWQCLDRLMAGIVYFFVGVAILIFVLYLLSELYDSFYPSISDEWVYIKANGEITKGTIYESDAFAGISRTPMENGGLPADGLFLDKDKKKKTCSRTYQIKNEILDIVHGNNDLTEAARFTYQIGDKLLAWGNFEDFSSFKESIVNGVHVGHLYSWIRPLTHFDEQLYRIEDCKGINCKPSLNEKNIYSGWIWDIRLKERASHTIFKAQRYLNGKLVEEFFYEPDDSLQPTKAVQEEIEKRKKEAKAEIDALRKKFRQGLNITDEKLETCSYWFGTA